MCDGEIKERNLNEFPTLPGVLLATDSGTIAPVAFGDDDPRTRFSNSFSLFMQSRGDEIVDGGEILMNGNTTWRLGSDGVNLTLIGGGATPIPSR
jgi:hypothetical protein